MLRVVADLPLIPSLRASGRWIQNWYADDSSCAADLPSLQNCFEELLHKGPDYGYYPEPSKTVLVVDPSGLKWASELFTNFTIRIVLVDNFWVDLLVMILCFPVRYRCCPAVFVSFLMWLLLSLISLRLLMLHWPDLYRLKVPFPESNS